MSIAQYLEHLFWTVVLAFVNALVAPPILDKIPGVELSIDVLGAAVFAAAIAFLEWIILVARVRLAVLPSPGQGLPGLRVRNAVTVEPTAERTDR